VRAALAYAGLGIDEAISKIGGAFGAATLRRITSTAHPRGASLDELWLIADACGVPRSWFADGEWKDKPAAVAAVPQPFGQGTPEQRLETVERYLAALLRLEQSRMNGKQTLGEDLPLPDLGREDQPLPDLRRQRAPRSARPIEAPGRAASS